MSNGIGAVLFDFGNTLFAHAPLAATIVAAGRSLGRDVQPEWAAALAATIEQVAHTPDELARGRDLDDEVWRERWHVLYGLGDDLVPGLGAEVFRLMHEPAEWQPYASTVEVLATLRDAGVPIGVVSNTGWDVRTVFAHHLLTSHVDQFVLSYETDAVKPSRRIFDTACRRLGCAPDAVLMVGDDPVADAGAVRAGMRTLLLPALPPGADNGLAGVVGLVGRVLGD